MKLKIKKFPLLVSLIVSCAIVIASIFVLAFAGMNIGTSLAGGSQIKITMDENASSKQYVAEIKEVLKDNGYVLDSSFIQDDFQAADENGELTTKSLVVNIADKDIDSKTATKIIDEIAAKLEISKDNISDIEETSSAIKAKDILFIGLAFGIIAVVLFVFAWIRYDIFAGLSFILSMLHNLILYLSLLIVTRVQLNLISIAVALVLTIIMCSVLVAIYEKHREVSRLHISEKETITETMINAVKTQTTPFAIIGGAILIFACIMFFVPVAAVCYAAIAIIISLIVTIYTCLIIGPGAYAGLLEIKNVNEKAVLSRNDTINKEIKKKIKKSSKSK